jgi:trans-aconitate methyltransferase
MNVAVDPAPAAGQRWNSADYARHGRFVADLGASLLDWLAPEPGERILDIGCGDGVLTGRLVEEAGAVVVGIDASPELVATARQHGIDARLMDAQALQFDAEFDAVFSNAALHWMKRDPDAVIAGAFRALRPGGRFVAELGAAGNVALIRGAIYEALGRRGIDAIRHDPWYFPTLADYRGRLAAAGFAVERIETFSRPTVLPGDVSGWLTTFAQAFLQALPPEQHKDVLAEVQAALAPHRSNIAGQWTADYVRLRFKALKPKTTT